MDDVDDATVAARLAVELRGKQPTLDVSFQPWTVFQLSGLIQLSLRHPGVTPEIRATAARFLAGVRAYFADCPTVLDVVRRGDDPGQDRPARKRS